MSQLTYKWLSGQEAIDAIDPIIQDRGWMTLNASTTRVRAAYNEHGRLVAFLVLQLMPHTEPMFVCDDYRGCGIAEQLADDMVEFLREVNCRGWLVVADSPHAAKICESRGMVKVTSPVYKAEQK